MKRWYNPVGKSIVNGGAAVQMNDDNTEAEAFVVRSLGNGKVAAFVTKFVDIDFFNGGCYEGFAEKTIGEDAESVFESWEEQQIAGFFVMAADKLPFHKLHDVFPLDICKQENNADIQYYQEYDELIISRAKALGVL